MKQEDLKKIIEYAVENIKDKKLELYCLSARIDETGFRCSDIEKEDVYNIIFNHDFLKAYFGEEKPFVGGDTVKVNKDGTLPVVGDWRMHAQQLVILPDKEKIEYLIRYIK